MSKAVVENTPSVGEGNANKLDGYVALAAANEAAKAVLEGEKPFAKDVEQRRQD